MSYPLFLLTFSSVALLPNDILYSFLSYCLSPSTFLFYSLIKFQCLRQLMTHTRIPVNVCWMTESLFLPAVLSHPSEQYGNGGSCGPPAKQQDPLQTTASDTEFRAEGRASPPTLGRLMASYLILTTQTITISISLKRKTWSSEKLK